jgi:hypothetical protein
VVTEKWGDDVNYELALVAEPFLRDVVFFEVVLTDGQDS